MEDEFSASSVIEDDEARALMAVTALKSCKDTLVNVQEQEKRSTEDTRIESERIKNAKEKLKALRSERGQAEEEIEDVPDENTGTGPPTMTPENESCDLEHESIDIQSICEKVKDHFMNNSDTSVADLAEKIDELVNKVINLELTVSSQSAQIEHLRSQIDELQKYLRSLEEEKASIIDGSNSLNDRLKQAEEELQRVQILEKRLKTEKSMLRKVFAEACHSLSDISEKLHSPKHSDQVNVGTPKLLEHVEIANPLPSHEEDKSLVNIEQEKASDVNDTMKIHNTKEEVEEKNQENKIQSEQEPQIENGLRKSEPEKQEDETREKEPPQENDTNHVNTDPENLISDPDDAPNLQELLLNGLEGREKILLAEYTSILRTYKETKRKLLEVEKKNQEYFSETMSQVKELKSANAIKDEEIQLLRQILSSLQTGSNLMQNSAMLEGLNVKGTVKKDASGVQEGGALHTEEDIKLYLASVQQTTSPVEEKFRKDIDTLLDENLEFWLRFSTAFHQIQRFRTDFQNLQAAIEKDSNKEEGSNSATENSGKRESTPLDKQLRELKTEFQVWLEQNALLRGELQSRFSSLCNIQEEISGALKASSEAGGVQFTPYQAAKFQGEVLNMQQENNKVAVELQAGLDHVKGLQADVEKTLSKLHEKFELSASKSSRYNHFRHFSTKSKGVPLRSFLYGVKPKKPSIFSCMSPALQKQYSDLRAGMPL